MRVKFGIVVMLLLVGALGAFAQTVSVDTVTTRTGSGAGSLDAAFSGPRPTSLTNAEGGGDRQNGLMTKINANTFITLSPGADRLWGTTDDGVVHCFGVGTAGEGCEFILLSSGGGVGALQGAEGESHQFFVDTDGSGTTDLDVGSQDDSKRAAIRMNTSTALVLGAGALIGAPQAAGIGSAPTRAIYCEDKSSMGFTSGVFLDDDELHILRDLGAAGATVETISSIDIDGDGTADVGMCFGTFAADPVRVSGDVAVFAHPGLDGWFHDTDACVDNAAQLDKDDLIVVLRNLGAGVSPAAATVEVHDVGAALGVYLSGAPASRAVRVSRKSVVFASPGPDGEFADPTGSFCSGAITSDAEDDGLIVVKGLGPVGTTIASFVTLGPMAANPYTRPRMVNENPGTVVTLGTGPDHDQMEQDCFCGFDLDDQIHTVSNLRKVADTPSTTTHDGFGYMRRFVRISDARAVVGEENEADASGEEEVKLNILVLKGLGLSATPSVKTVPVPVGDTFAPHFEPLVIDGTAGTVLIPVAGPFQMLLLDESGAPPYTLTGAGGSAEYWAMVMAERVNSTTAVYIAAIQGAVGVLKIVNGNLKDTRLLLAGEGRTNDFGILQPGSVPVRLNDSQAVILSGGATEFIEQGFEADFGGDDGFFLIEGLDTNTPTWRFVVTGGGCGGPGCRPLRLTGTAVVLQGPGANGQFDSNDDESDNDDELIFVTGL